MFPWKLLFRFFSAMMLMATGGFAARHDIPLPFVPSPAPVPAAPAPAAPVDADAPSVCAAAATSACAPVDPTVDDSHTVRVQRCVDWWNSLADAFKANNRPDWAAKATELANNCDAFVTRWEQWE